MIPEFPDPAFHNNADLKKLEEIQNRRCHCGDCGNPIYKNELECPNCEVNVIIDSDSVTILKGKKEIVKWLDDEWIEDPSVTLVIATAIKDAYERRTK